MHAQLVETSGLVLVETGPLSWVVASGACFWKDC